MKNRKKDGGGHLFAFWESLKTSHGKKARERFLEVPFRFCGALCIVFLFITGGFVEGEEIRTWTSAKGNTVKAKFIRKINHLVILEKENGNQIKIALHKLSPTDQKWLSGGGKNITENAPEQIPEVIIDLFGKKLFNAKKSRTSTSVLSGKKIGIYFSASWCGPCRGFTPELVKVHKKLQKDGKPFEVVFVSSDRNKKDMFRYMSDDNMPWLAVEYDSTVANNLKERFKVRGIPTLVIVNDKGKTISRNARSDILNMGAKAFDKW